VLNSTPAVTAVGTPLGQPVTATIGAAGGTLSSADGALQLTVPAGALSTNTALSVQALSTTAPGSVLAFRLTPEGTTFSAPATITFHFAADALQGSSTSALGVAYQDADHHWRTLLNPTLKDQTISVKTTHLSDWSLVRGWQLRPPSAQVKLGASLSLTVTYCAQVDVNGGQSSEGELFTLAAECQKDTDDLGVLISNWAVNGVTSGGSSSGTVTQGNPTAVYTAPSTAPSGTQAVSVELNPGRVGKTLLVSNVTVGDVGPSSFSGTLKVNRKAGGGATGLTQLDYAGHATVQLAPWPAQGPHTYSMSGTFFLDSATVELGSCLCIGSSGQGELADQDNSFGYMPSETGPGGTYQLGFSTEVMVSLTCTPLGPGAVCRTTPYPLTVLWSLPQSFVGGCTGSASSTYTDVHSIMGSSQEQCMTDSGITKTETVSWSLTGHD
jgi:hypothetical protein